MPPAPVQTVHPPNRRKPPLWYRLNTAPAEPLRRRQTQGLRAT